MKKVKARDHNDINNKNIKTKFNGDMPLKELEEQKGLTPEEVIASLKEKGVVISNSTYRSWRDNRVNFHRKELLALADVFEVSVDYLLGRADLAWQKSEEIAFPWRLRRVPVGEEEELVEAFKAVLRGKMPQGDTNFLHLGSVIDDRLIELDIDFSDSGQWDVGLQEKLKLKFGLRQAFIPKKPIPKALSLIIIGEVAAKFFVERIRTGRVSISGGLTLSRMVMSLRRYYLSGLEIFPLEVLPVSEKVAISSNTICGMFELFHFQKVHSHGLQHIIQQEETAQAYLGEIRRLLSEASGLENAVVVSVGALQNLLSPTTLFHIVLNALKMNVDELVESHLAVGDILFHAFDISGNEVDHPINRLILSVDLDRLRTMAQLSERPVVAVAAGLPKAKAVYGALKGRYVNTVILDRELAEKVMERAEIEDYKGRLSENVKKMIKHKALERIASEIAGKQNSWVKRLIKLAMELSEKEREIVSQIPHEQNLEELKNSIESLEAFNRMRWEIEDRLSRELLKAGIQPSNEKSAIRILNVKTVELIKNPLTSPGTS